jgi:Protein of unknown function (DUF1573)
MKRQIVAVMMWTTLAGYAARAEGAPKIVFDQTTYDFGVTSAVEAVEGKFTFTNTGDGVLKVEKPKPACGCTVASVIPDSLKPGEKGALTFTLNLTHAKGPTEKSITVPSNDPQNPSVKLAIKADVKPIFAVNPELLFLGDIAPGKTGTTSVEVKRLDGKKLAITKTEASKGFILSKVEPVESSQGQAAKITVEAKADGQPRRFSSMLLVYTEDATKPALTIPMTGRFLSEIVLEPETMLWQVNDPTNWPGADAEKAATRDVTIYAAGEKQTLHVRNVTSSLKELQVQLNTLETNMSYEIVATLPKPPAQSVTGNIEFETDLPSLPKVQVPVTINVQSSQTTGHVHQKGATDERHNDSP